MTIFLDAAKDFIVKELNLYLDWANFELKIPGTNKLLTRKKIELVEDLIKKVDKQENCINDTLNLNALKNLVNACLASSSQACGSAETPKKTLEKDYLLVINGELDNFYNLFLLKDLIDKTPQIKNTVSNQYNPVSKIVCRTSSYEHAHDIFRFYAASVYIEKSTLRRKTGALSNMWSIFVGGPYDNTQDLDAVLNDMNAKFINSAKDKFDENSQREILKYAIRPLLVTKDDILKLAMNKAFQEIESLPPYLVLAPLAKVKKDSQSEKEELRDTEKSESMLSISEALEEINNLASPGVIPLLNNRNISNNKKKPQDKISVGIKNTLHGNNRNSQPEENLVEKRNFAAPSN